MNETIFIFVGAFAGSFLGYLAGHYWFIGFKVRELLALKHEIEGLLTLQMSLMLNHFARSSI